MVTLPDRTAGMQSKEQPMTAPNPNRTQCLPKNPRKPRRLRRALFIVVVAIAARG